MFFDTTISTQSSKTGSIPLNISHGQLQGKQGNLITVTQSESTLGHAVSKNKGKFGNNKSLKLKTVVCFFCEVSVNIKQYEIGKVIT